MKIPVLLAMTALLHGAPVQADTYSFAAVKNSGVSAADVGARNYNYTDWQLLDHAAIATASGDGNAARAQTLPGVNRIEVSNTLAVSDEFIRETGIGGPFALAISAWTDDFVIHGGTGAGTLRLSVNVTGRFGDGYGSSGGYGLWLSTPTELRSEVTQFLSQDPLTWLTDTLDDPEDGGETLVLSYLANVLKPGHTDPGLSLPGGSAFGSVLATEVPFVYGEAFSLAGVLYGFANDGGSLSAMNSAHFGISVLDAPGASITSASGTAYAAAVPEPGASALWLPGLAGLAWGARRRAAR